ncbi:hypothetical protein [Anaerolinea sp.]|nr:hypothetical protein [Anaerolinea sp.]
MTGFYLDTAENVDEADFSDVILDHTTLPYEVYEEGLVDDPDREDEF